MKALNSIFQIFQVRLHQILASLANRPIMATLGLAQPTLRLRLGWPDPRAGLGSGARPRPGPIAARGQTMASHGRDRPAGARYGHPRHSEIQNFGISEVRTFGYSDFQRCKLQSCKLQSCKFQSCKFQSCKFQSCKFQS